MEGKVARRDPLFYADKAFGEMPDLKYRAEVELAERYQSFVAEILRLSLLGIAGFGYLYKEMLLKLAPGASFVMAEFARVYGAVGVIMFGLSAFCALVFRHEANEGIRYYIMALRFRVAGDPDSAQESLEERKRRIRTCLLSKLFAAGFFAYGGCFVAISMSLLVIYC